MFCNATTAVWFAYIGSSSCQNTTAIKILESPLGCTPSQYVANAMQLVTCSPTSGSGAAAVLGAFSAGVLALAVAVLAIMYY